MRDDISTHAPVKERLGAAAGEEAFLAISTHAPVKERLADAHEEGEGGGFQLTLL